ncbi:hypothetical protein ACFFJN_12700, partial [Erwinia mallotivora]
MARNIAPGYCVVERPGTLGYQARELFRDMRSPAVSLFMQLNADTHIRRQLVLPAGANYSGRIRCLVALSHAGCCLRCF